MSSVRVRVVSCVKTLCHTLEKVCDSAVTFQNLHAKHTGTSNFKVLVFEWGPGRERAVTSRQRSQLGDAHCLDRACVTLHSGSTQAEKCNPKNTRHRTFDKLGVLFIKKTTSKFPTCFFLTMSSLILRHSCDCSIQVRELV